MTELEAALEAVLFASGDAVSIKRLADALEVEKSEVLRVAESLQSCLDYQQSGVVLVRMEDKFQLCTRAQYAEQIRKITESRRPPALSSAALEVLTIVAYRQPVTRAFIDQLRGVDSSGTVAGLLDKGLIIEAGTLDVPGRPTLFKTTDVFLRTFSIQSLDELPDLPALSENEQLQLDMEVTEEVTSGQGEARSLAGVDEAEME